ncbi:MAG: FkbM family methyltransferase [Magnetococcales bacterium]|nr:FkbM family methyltransferase [Magnetococcales bacterium]
MFSRFRYKNIAIVADGKPLHFTIPRSKRIEEVIRNGFARNLEYTRRMMSILPPWHTLLDIGGNVGYQAVLYALVDTNARPIHTFEPSQTNYACLVKNSAPYPNIVPHPFGLSDQNASGHLSMPDLKQYPKLKERSDNTGMLSLYGHGKRESSSVSLRVLDPWAAEQGIATDGCFIKIDVEGHEWHILQGAHAFLAGNNTFHVEFNPFAMRMSGMTGEQIIAKFAAHDYAPYLFSEQTLEAFDPQSQSLPGGKFSERTVNLLFLKNR